MKKVIVIGCPGSGKSRLSKALSEKTGLPLYHLDMMYWKADKTQVEKSLFLERLSEAIENEEWLIDGNYSSTMEMRLEACDTVIFLDFPKELCIKGIMERFGKPRSDMPWTDTELDPWLKSEIENFGIKNLPDIYSLLEKYGDGKEIVVFKSREEADNYLARLNTK